MKTILKIEELAQLLLGIFLFAQTGWSWWWFAGLFFLPDLGMIGYAINNRAGALLYNILHHKAVGIALFLSGFYLISEYLQIAGIIIFAHSAFDRMLGYGLKYEKGFKFTHLGNL